MKKIKIIREVFDKLHEKIVEECERKGVRSKAKAAGFYGFNHPWATRDRTVRQIMNNSLEVRNHIIEYCELEDDVKGKTPTERKEITLKYISGKYLYDRKLNFEKKGMNPVLFSGIYVKAYFIFLGYKDIFEFLDENDFSDKVKDIQKSLIEGINDDNYISNLAIQFRCFYFQNKSNTVQSFFLDVDYLNNYTAKEVGFHSREEYEEPYHYEKNSNLIFVGHGVKGDNHLHFNLTPKSGKNNFLTISIYTGGIDITSKSVLFLRGVLTTMSSHGYLVSHEVFFLRKSDNPNYNQTIDVINQYLHLERKSISISTQPILDISELSSKNYPLNSINNMVGTWRRWSVTPDGDIFQSKLTINKDYSAYLELDNSNVTKKRGLLNITSGGNLCVTATLKDEIRNFSIIKIPPMENYNDHTTITSGVYSAVCASDKLYKVGIILLLRDKTKFTPTIIRKGNFHNFIITQPLLIAYKTLQKLQKENEKKLLFDLNLIPADYLTDNRGYE